MKERGFWIETLERAWGRRSVVWLHGVRRTGKTFLCRSLHDVEYFDCELPHSRREMEDPEEFLAARRGKTVALDEIHRLPDPAALLKIAADHFPDVRIVATGSSTLQANARFRDTLTGRKAEVWLTPMCEADLADFGSADLVRRLGRGGLPPFFLAEDDAAGDFQEWMDSFWARDVLDLFRLERRHAFQTFLELLFTASGGIFEASRYAAPCEISRPTVSNYLSALDAVRAVHVVRPFSSRRADEIVSAPKVFGMDTGFVRHFRGWKELRPEDLGILWEHYVLNEIHAVTQERRVQYWRDKRGHEVDFVLAPPGGKPVAVECKWKADGFDPAGLAAFRARHPAGPNWVVARDVPRPFARTVKGLRVEFLGLRELGKRLRKGT
jgi:predicted AAA+ superfamily ATPase